MFRKIFFVLAAFFLLSSQAFAQQTAQKVLVIVNTRMNDRPAFGAALWRILELQKSGVDVRVVFEGEAVTYFLPQETLSKLEKPVAIIDDVDISTECTESAAGPNMACRKIRTAGGGYISKLSYNNAPPPGPNVTKEGTKFRFTWPAAKGEMKKELYASGQEAISALMDALGTAKVPYTLCSLSATQLGVYDQLKQRGLPMSEDPGGPVGIVQYINDNYRIINF